MPVTESHDVVPRPRRWPWALLAVGVLFIVMFGVIAYRNQQQWSRALKFHHEVERAGGNAEIIARYGTDFAQGPFIKVESRWQRMVTWPIVAGVILPASAEPLQIDWSVAPQVKLGGLRVAHDQFTDDEFAKIPTTTQFHVLFLETPAITNRSLPRLQQIPTLDRLSTIGSAIEGPGLLQLAHATTCTLSVKVNTQELAALKQAGAISRLDDLELHSPGDFQADQLTGLPAGIRCKFTGRYEPGAFAAIEKFANRPYFKFQDAQLPAEALSDLARISKLNDLKLMNCQIAGTLREVEPATKDARALTLEISGTEFSPDLLAAFGGRSMYIFVEGNFADDAWLESVMQVPGLQEVTVFDGTRITDETIDKYARNHADPSRAKRIPYAHRSSK